MSAEKILAENAAKAARDRSAHLALWRARFGFQVVSSLTLLLLLAIVLFGLGKSWKADLGEYYVSETIGTSDQDVEVFNPIEGITSGSGSEVTTGSEGVYRQFNEFIYNNPNFVDGLHKYGGYLMVFLMPLCGYLLIVCARRHGRAPILRLLGIITITLSLMGSVAAVGSGRLSGRALPQVEEVGRETISITKRTHKQEEALQTHLESSYYLVGLSVVLVMLGGVMVSTPSMKSAAGIGKDKKGS